MRRLKRGFSTTQLIMLSFLAAILLGSLLLCLPISSANGASVSYVDALFTATTATCVTGLVTVPTYISWSVFGQAVILLLIQIGGLGIITIMSGVMLMLHKKMNTSDRLLLQEAFNLNSLSGLSQFVKKVIFGTFVVEILGALGYMTVFVPKYGAKGIWVSFFTSVSAFCNAGIDIISNDSLCEYVTNPVINGITSLLIIFGGLGYIVWWDVIRVLRLHKKRPLRYLSLHSKIAVSATLAAVFLGAVLIFAFEYNNPQTIKNFSLFDKIQFSLFQSVTTRTAGFATLPQQSLSNGAALVSMLLMFIGGSPVGTAGGIKTVTAAVLIAAVVSAVKNKKSVTLFGREIKKSAVIKAVGVFGMSSLILIVSTLLLSFTVDAPLLDIMYETVSATATVGLTRGLTTSLNTAAKLIITATMYLGRVGPITLALAFSTQKPSDNLISNPTEEISIG